MKIYMRLPATYEQDILTIKCLGLSSAGWPAEEAFANLVKNTPEFYNALVLGKLVQENGKYSIILPKNEKVYNKILELEPLPEEAEKKRKKQSHLLDVSPEDVIKYGY